MAKLSKENKDAIKKIVAAQERYYKKWLKQWAKNIRHPATPVHPEGREGA